MHHGAARIGPADLAEARRNEELHGAGEERRTAHPRGLKSIGVDRMTLNRGRALLSGVGHSCVEQRASHADATKTPLDRETRHPPGAVIVGKHATQRPIGHDTGNLVSGHHPCPPRREPVNVGENAGRHWRCRHLQSKR